MRSGAGDGANGSTSTVTSPLSHWARFSLSKSCTRMPSTKVRTAHSQWQMKRYSQRGLPGHAVSHMLVYSSAAVARCALVTKRRATPGFSRAARPKVSSFATHVLHSRWKVA